jgi:hypothetical protein
MKPTRTISSYVLLIGVLGLSIVGGVLAFQIYSAAVKNQTTTEQTIAIKPIDGSIDQKVIDNLSKRTVYTEAEMAVVLGAVTTPTPEATQAAVTTSPEATGSGTTTQ